MKDEDGLDFKYKCNNQGEVDVLFYELICLFFLEICVIIGEKKNEVLMECKVKFVGSLLFKFLDKEEYEQNDCILGKMDEIVVEEMIVIRKVE